MSRGWGTFRTVGGSLTVEDDALRIDRRPKKYLRGQLSRWRDERPAERLRAVANLLALVGLPFLLAWQLSELFGASTWGAALVAAGLLVLNLAPAWNEYYRDTVIPLSAVESVDLDPDARELTVAHGATGRFSLLDWGDDEETLTLRTDAEVRELGSLLRTRGLVDETSADDEGPTETTYGYLTRDGVVFCEQCESQVSPNDRRCPACDAALRPERAGERSREPAVE